MGAFKVDFWVVWGFCSPHDNPNFWPPWKNPADAHETDNGRMLYFYPKLFFCSPYLKKKLYIGILKIDQHQSQLRSFWANVKWSSKSFIECFCWSSVLWLHGRCQRVLFIFVDRKFIQICKSGSNLNFNQCCPTDFKLKHSV